MSLDLSVRASGAGRVGRAEPGNSLGWWGAGAARQPSVAAPPSGKGNVCDEVEVAAHRLAAAKPAALPDLVGQRRGVAAAAAGGGVDVARRDRGGVLDCSILADMTRKPNVGT